MKVEYGTGTSYPTQTIVQFNTGNRFFRVFAYDVSNWKNWISYVTDSNLALNNTKIESRSDSSSLSITVTDITNGEALYIGYAKSSGEYRLNHKSTTGSWDGEKKIITS